MSFCRAKKQRACHKSRLLRCGGPLFFYNLGLYSNYPKIDKFFKPCFSILIMVERTCKDCGKTFEQKKKSRYPRKYCDKCSAQRKKDYEKIHLITVDECEEE